MDKRVKSGLAVTPAHLKLCDDNIRRAQADSRNEFVEKAIEFYAGYLNAEQNPKFFDEMFPLLLRRRWSRSANPWAPGSTKSLWNWQSYAT